VQDLDLLVVMRREYGKSVGRLVSTAWWNVRADALRSKVRVCSDIVHEAALLIFDGKFTSSDATIGRSRALRGLFRHQRSRSVAGINPRVMREIIPTPFTLAFSYHWSILITSQMLRHFGARSV
jgi:hypothetical protein